MSPRKGFDTKTNGLSPPTAPLQKPLDADL